MLWYGYIYYVFFNFLLLSVLFFYLRLFFLYSISRVNTTLVLNRIFLTLVCLIFIVTLTVLNYLLDYYQDLLFLSTTTTNTDITILTLSTYDKLFTANTLNLNLCQVYYYPFIYVFLLVTTLSIFFCLSYNTDELVAFMFYCQVILLAGYVLFFTNSLVLFFLSYEMLLVPSFFILYKFAKTRRCVEAAYLMFF